MAIEIEEEQKQEPGEPEESVPVEERLNSYYRIIKLDLTEARTQKEFKLQGVYSELSVIQSPSAFDIFVDMSFGAIPVAAFQTLSLEDFCIKDAIFITNAVGAGTAVIWLAGYKGVESRCL